MKKFAGSKNHKFNRTRLIGLTAILLAAVVFISALPNLRAQTASSRSFFGLADLFSWQKAAITPPTSGANDDIIAAPLDTKTVCSAGADFATLTLAVADANTAVPAGGRTYNVCAGFTETAPAGGYSITATGASAANPVVFVKSGAGANPTITASAALTAGALNDAIFKIIGADNITIDGFTMLENAANTTTAVATNNMTEFGVALFYATTTDGAQNITLQNNTITLNRTYQNTFGIYANATHSATAVSTTASATTTAGGNSGLKIYTNAINNVNQGIVVVGPTAAADLNNGVDIGGTSAAQGNTITNFGTTGTFSTYANVSVTVNGILVRNSTTVNSSFNTIISSVGGTTVGTLNGIQIPAANAAPTTAFTTTVSNNNISLQHGLTTGTIVGITQPSGSASTTSSFIANNNNFNTFGHTVAAASGSITFITSASTHLNNTISNNTFTNLNLTTTGSVTFISNSVTVPAGGTQTIGSNSIVTAFNKTGAGGTVTGITTGGSSTTVTSNWNNNNFSNLTVTGATAITFINHTDGGTVNHNISGNTFSNITGGTSAIIGINSSFGGGNGGSGNLVSNNTVSNITSAGAISGITIGSSGTSSTVTGNNVNTLASSGASLVVGITSAAPTSNSISKNKIYDLSGSNASSTVTGLTVTAGTLHTVFNNIIGNLTTPAANAANPLIGLNITGGTTVNVYFNTVYLNGASTGALFGSSAISASTTPALTLRNNIFSNASTVTGAGLAVAYRRSSPTLMTYQSASNNNDFNASTIYNDGTTSQTTVAAYKALVSPRDSASFNEAPNFLSTTGSSANFLHISAATATQLESGGATISGITDDFDGQTRNVTTPDIGADEFTGIGQDLSAPNINYTNLANTASTANRVLTATITDATGVASGGLAPRIYYRKNGGAYFSSTCAGSSPTYTCTIVVADLGGVAATNVIDYFVVAQDTLGNLGSNPGGAIGASVNSITTPPTPNTYTIIPTISGIKNVGTGGDFATLTAAVAALNGGEISGAVVLTLTDASYSAGEIFPLTINANNGSSASNTVTIKPASGVISTISGLSTGCIIGFNGADFMTIDGSNSMGGTTRDLTITNTGTGTTSAVVCIQNTAALDGATNNVVKNTNIVGNSNTTTLFGVFSGGTAISATSVGTGNNTNIIQNNNLSKTQFGIYSQGASTANKNTGNIISQNLINTASPNNVAKGGIQVGFENNVTISQNKIDGISTITDDWGITLGLTSWTATSFTGNEVTNATVTRNLIGTIVNTGTNSVAGIAVAPATSGTNLIANNSIYGVIANSTPSDLTTGIFVTGGTGSTTNIYYNSVSMTGDRGTGTSAPSYALAVAGTIPVVDIRNNALYNTQFSAGTGKSYAIGFGYSSTVGNYANLTSNYNDLFSSGAVSGFAITGSLTQGTGIDQPNLGALTTETGRDTPNSLSVDPLFVAATDLHLQTASTLINAGTTIAGIAIDIDGDVRPGGPAPDIGSDEAFIPAVPGTVQFSSVTYAGNEGTTATVAVTRSAGNAGAISVNYATSNGTATAGTCGTNDYVAASGTLNWADMETASKTFLVTLCSDAVIDPAETVNLTLSGATGGASIGANNPAVLTIGDVAPPFNGAFTVGSGGNYPSLTNAGGIFEAINTAGATGNVTVNITSDLTAENGTVALNEVAGGFTVLIKPSGAARSISGTSATNIIKLSGADGVTIDGSLSGGTDRSLTINITGNGAAIWNATNATSGANSNTFKNLNIAGGTPFTSQGIFSSSGTTLGNAAEFAQSNNTIQNNSIIRVQNAVFTTGNATTLDQNLMVTGNTFGSATVADKLGFRGVIVQNAQNFTVTRNTISGISSTTATSSTMSGIQIGGVINGGSVTRNDIKDIRQNNTTGWGSNGIYLISSSTAANVLVANNFVSDIASQGFAGAGSGDNGYGIMIDTGAGYNIYHNTVVMNTNQVAVGSVTAALNIAAAVTTAAGIDVRDNILANIQTIGTQYSVYDASTAAIFADINYNDYYTVENVGFLTSARVTLANWQTATTKDANSISVDPTFVSTTDFHIQTGSPAINTGITVAGVTVDFDGQTRDATPDIGADEIIAANTAPTITAVGVTRQAGSPVSNSTIANVTDDGGNGVVVVTVTTANPSNGVTVSTPVNTNGTITANVVAACGATTATFTLQASDGTLTTTTTLTVTVTANTAPTLTYNNASVPNGGATTVNPATGPIDNGSVSTIAVQSAGTYTGTISVNNTTGVVSISGAAPVGTHTITIRATDNCGLTTDATFMLTVTSVNTPPTITAVGVTRQAGSPASNSTIANVTDDGGNGAVVVTVTTANPSNGVTISNIVNTGGVITANVVAACGATTATFTLQASDGTLTTTATLTVTVTANTAPTLTYANASVASGGATTVSPATGPSDNGSVSTIVVQSQGTFTGTVTVNNTTGVVSIGGAAPIGTHTITIRATDNCNLTTDSTFTVTVNNNSPTITAGAAVTRQQGSTAAATIATVSDPDQSAGTLSVTATTVPSGITITSIINNSGTITATVAAACNATIGANTVVLTVNDSNGGSSTANFTVNVTANTPPTLTYANASVASGGATTVNPATGPSDNGSVSSIVLLSQGTYTGTITVNPTTGVVSISGAAPVGTHTITIRATDNCNLTTDSTFTLTVNATNQPPTIAAVGVTRQAGSPVSNSTIANATDDGGNGAVVVTVTTANPSNGVTISNIVNTNGVITANVVAACGATTATFTLQASDGTLTTTATLTVTVTANTAPTLTYANASVASGGATTVNPASGPSDNGSVSSIVLLSQGTYTGTITVNPTTGVVSISGAAPVGTHTITIRATDNCNLTTDSTFTLTVTATNQPPTIAAVGVTRQAGSPVSNSTIANVTDDGGNGAVVVTVTTANPSNGVTISNIVNTNGVITANVVAACGATTATFTLQASDGTLTTTTTLTVTVTANSAPTLSYSNASVATGGATTVNPLTGPSDNGSVSTIAVQSQGTFTGTVMVNNTTGIVSISNAGPVGTHTITIRATDNCMTTTDATFTVTVSGGDVTAPVISYTLIPNESVNPTLSVTITDAVGVTSATIFFKINGAAVYSSNACTGTAGSTNSVWNCPITGTASGQAISYYVAAADAAGNIGYNPTTNAMAPNLYTIGAATVPSGTYSNITLSSNTSFGGGITVNKVLTLNGVVDMGANTLTLGCNATVSGGGGGNYVIGNLAKQYCATGTFIYPVGTTPNGSRQLGNSSEYSPFTAVITAIGTVPSTLTVSVTDAFLPGSSVTQSASRYWNVLETGDLTANISFTYLDPLDVTGTETNYQVLRREGVTTAVFAGGSVNAATNTATAPGVTNFSQWAAGVLDPSAAPVEVGGRVRQPNGRGIFRARIVLQDSNGDVRTAYTNPFGYYRFTDVQVGETYIFTVWHRRYQFVSPTQVHSFVEDDHGINFVSSGETVNFRPEATFFDHAPFDFDGDGRTDVAVYRNTDHYWYIKRSSDNTLLSQTFGAAGDRLVPADYDGDGRTDIAVFRPSNGVWYIWLSASNALRVENFGTASDQPIPSDFDGDGKADVSVWNELKGIWQVKLSSNGATVTERFANGRGDFIPLASDRDGDGKADFIFFNQADGTWKFRLSESRTEVEEHFGQFGDRALMGDFDGDGRGDLAIYRGGENAWSIKLADGGELKAVVFGENADAQATGDFDGDGRTDLTNFKNGVWSIRQSINGIVREQRFGLASDTVIPSPFNR